MFTKHTGLQPFVYFGAGERLFDFELDLERDFEAAGEADTLRLLGEGERFLGDGEREAERRAGERERRPLTGLRLSRKGDLPRGGDLLPPPPRGGDLLKRGGVLLRGGDLLRLLL